MKIIIMDQLSNDEYVNRDQMGGLGIGSLKSKYFIARLVGKMKKNMIRVPNMISHQVVACAKFSGHDVVVGSDIKDIPVDVDMIVIPTSMVACNKECKFALQAKDTFPKAKIVFMGMFGTIYPEKYLPYGHVVISGEPESYFLRLKIKDDISDGLVKSERIEDLDSLPFPDWESFNISQYSYKPILKKYPMVTMLTSKSCVYSCAYCPYPLSYGKLRKRNVDKVIEEMLHLKNNLGVKSVVFRDPLFTFSKPRSAELFQKMIDHKIDIEWVCETRFDHLDENLIDLAVKAGMKGVNVGVEAGNLDVLKSVNRKVIKFDHQKNMVDYMRKKGVWVTGFYILGHDTDTMDTMEQTFKFSKYLNTPIAQFTISTPIPHAPEFRDQQEKLLSSDPEEYTFFNPVLKATHLSQEQISQQLNTSLSRYYFRPDYFIKNFKYYVGSGR